MAGVRRIGSEELIRDIESWARRSPEAAERGVLRAGGEIVARAKSNTPKRTGRARESIHVGGHPELSGEFSPGGGGWGAYRDMGEYEDRSGTRMGIAVGSTLFYFRFIEDGGARNVAVRPIGRAVDEVEPLLVGFIEEEVGRLAEELNL